MPRASVSFIQFPGGMLITLGGLPMHRSQNQPGPNFVRLGGGGLVIPSVLFLPKGCPQTEKKSPRLYDLTTLDLTWTMEYPL
jgi:hypothetical protein